MKIKEIAEQFSIIFEREGWVWTDKDGTHTPRAKEIEKVIRDRIEHLKNIEYPNTMSFSSMGRIVVSKHQLTEEKEPFYRVALSPLVIDIENGEDDEDRRAYMDTHPY